MIDINFIYSVVTIIISGIIPSYFLPYDTSRDITRKCVLIVEISLLTFYLNLKYVKEVLPVLNAVPGQMDSANYSLKVQGVV